MSSSILSVLGLQKAITWFSLSLTNFAECINFKFLRVKYPLSIFYSTIADRLSVSLTLEVLDYQVLLVKYDLNHLCIVIVLFLISW